MGENLRKYGPKLGTSESPPKFTGYSASYERSQVSRIPIYGTTRNSEDKRPGLPTVGFLRWEYRVFEKKEKISFGQIFPKTQI